MACPRFTLITLRLSRFQRAGADAEQGELAGERIGNGLEHEQRDGLVATVARVIGSASSSSSPGLRARRRRRARPAPAPCRRSGVHQRLDADHVGAARCRTTGKIVARAGRPLRSPAINCSSVRSPASKKVSIRASSLSATISTSRRAHLGSSSARSAGISCGHLARTVLGEAEGLHRDQVDHARELVLLADGDLHRNRGAAEALLDRLQTCGRKRRSPGPACSSRTSPAG